MTVSSLRQRPPSPSRSGKGRKTGQIFFVQLHNFSLDENYSVFYCYYCQYNQHQAEELTVTNHMHSETRTAFKARREICPRKVFVRAHKLTGTGGHCASPSKRAAGKPFWLRLVFFAGENRLCQHIPPRLKTELTSKIELTPIVALATKPEKRSQA